MYIYAFLVLMERDLTMSTDELILRILEEYDNPDDDLISQDESDFNPLELLDDEDDVQSDDSTVDALIEEILRQYNA